MSSGITATSMAHREQLANLFHQNWAALHPDDSPAIALTPTSVNTTVIGIRHVSRVRSGGSGSGIRQPTGVASVPTQPAPGHQVPSNSVAAAAAASCDQNIDDSLTSLTWLQNLNVMKLSASAASSASSSAYGAAGHLRGAVVTGGLISGSCHQYQHQATRPTGAVQPIQLNQPKRPASLTSTSSSCSFQRLGVDPNDVLDMSHLVSVASCRSVKSDPDVSSLQTCGSPSAGGTVNGSGGNTSPSLPPRLSPQPLTPNSDIVSGCGSMGHDGRPSPSPPALQAAFSGTGNGNGATTATKPPYSYATLICMAMNDAVDNRVTLAGIYGWIIENFAYYRTADPSWQNSIRHNLSLNKCFQRVQRDKSDPPGKGSYWTFNPDFQQIVDRDLFRKRGATACGAGGHHQPASKKPCRRSSSSNADDHRPQHQRRSGGHSRQQHRLDEHELELAGCQQLPAGNNQVFDDESDGLETDFVSSADFGDGSFNLADALDMSWSAILGRDIDESSHEHQQHQQQQQQTLQSRTADSLPTAFAHRSPSSGTTGSTGSCRDSDDDMLDELIRACADVDSELATPTRAISSVMDSIGSSSGVCIKDDRSTSFALPLNEGDDDLLGLDSRHVSDPVDLTVYGVGLRPPDWWSSLDIVGEFDGFAADSATISGDARRSSPQLQQQHQLQQQARDEAPHPWAENRDRADGRRSSHGATSDSDLSHRLFDAGGLSSSFDAGDHLLLMTSSNETPAFDAHDHLDDF